MTIVIFVQASFTIKELRELLNLEGCSTSCHITPDIMPELKSAISIADRPKKRLFELMGSHIEPKVLPNNFTKQCSIEFYTTIHQIFTDEKGRVCEIKVDYIR